jgi:hypothetical protein
LTPIPCITDTLTAVPVYAVPRYGIATCAWEELYLNGNELANEGAMALTKGLQGNDILTRLELKVHHP